MSHHVPHPCPECGEERAFDCEKCGKPLGCFMCGWFDGDHDPDNCKAEATA